MCELVGDFSEEVIESRTQVVSKNIVVNGLGKFAYNVYADHEHVVRLDCDLSDPSSRVNHSCIPNAKFEQVTMLFYSALYLTAFVLVLFLWLPCNHNSSSEDH